MTSRVDEQAPPFEAGIIGDFNAGDIPCNVFDFGFAENRYGQKLAEGLDGVKKAGRLVGADYNMFFSYIEGVALVAYLRYFFA